MSDDHNKVLIVEDEEQLASLLADYLQHSGYRTTHIRRGDEAIAAIRAEQPDLVLLDLMLPGKNGMEICRETRSFSDVPIIMVTARVEEIDRLLGLELGCDDYICKPFSPREVVARVKAVLRRYHPRISEDGASDPRMTLDEASYSVSCNGRRLDLTTVEFKLLATLVNKPGRIFTRDQLMDNIYSDHRIVSDRTVDSHIKKLRKKLDELMPDTDIIRSVYGVGYKYEPAE
ncbi:MAG: response regulator [Gammaproteobacteria bacterium]|nr:response regulator [Gammaproteobacteria bacterium]